MDKDEFLQLIGAHTNLITGLAWAGYQDDGRGVVVVEAADIMSVSEIYYVPDKCPGCDCDSPIPANTKAMVSEYNPHTQVVCLVDLPDQQVSAIYTARIPPQVCAEYCQDAIEDIEQGIEGTVRGDVFNTADVVN